MHVLDCVYFIVCDRSFSREKFLEITKYNNIKNKNKTNKKDKK